ncbi:cytochrome c-type biogenesis protein [Alkalilimnicola ehrlichii MLHE-1]|uniref:Cytochrome c-type biogenesis protein n=1 Tax=Alkalilimnicola ehrlichii (strain ATCC BAA-1101 / DSM 17681 / MLHE-1) TaxID=187272 RepID=Q0A802_ALKEH|nr:cytochrome c-type biogenesis protein [Alkalilimnicola ehrlichii]ABI57035.1 cytochrome C biogenesis protein [Alkalilimnicola ehrlichii MLHE-1]
MKRAPMLDTRAAHLAALGLILLALLAPPAAAIPVGTPLTFDNETQAQRYQTLIRELRCTVCQNQSLLDSNAALARDLRRQIYEMVRDGHSRRRIEQFMVDRYGDYVLYRPPLRAATWLLWGGPFLLLALGAGLYLAVLRRHSRGGGHTAPLTAEERARLQAIDRRLT